MDIWHVTWSDKTYDPNAPRLPLPKPSIRKRFRKWRMNRWFDLGFVLSGWADRLRDWANTLDARGLELDDE